MSNLKSKIWHRLTINDPDLSYGKPLASFIGSLLSRLNSVVKITVADIEGSGDPVRGLTQIGCVECEQSELMERLQFTNQLDWADFYFFETLENTDLNEEFSEFSIADNISKSILTVRVIDDSALDVFTLDVGLISYLKEKYPNIDVVACPLSEMDYPS